MEITASTKLGDIPALAQILPTLMYKVPFDRPLSELSIDDLRKDQPTWDADSMVRGLRRLAELAEQGNLLYDVYTAEECTDDSEKSEIKLLYMPAGTEPSDKPFVIGVAGGAYTCVCSLVESIPTAARLNELGYNVFIFNYRCMRDPLYPKPVEDLAAAVSYILDHNDQFGLQNTDYIVNGFSAGGNLTAVWGLESAGWGKYGLPKPKALFCTYAFISYDTIPAGPAREFISSVQFGKDASPETVRLYDVPEHFNANYPPCYIVQSKDDPAVSVRNSEWLKELLEAHGVPVRLELIETGGHGWGDGSGTAAAGWPDRAAAFEQSL